MFSYFWKLPPQVDSKAAMDEKGKRKRQIKNMVYNYLHLIKNEIEITNAIRHKLRGSLSCAV